MAKVTARQTEIAATLMPRDNANRDEYMRAALVMESGRVQREMIDAAKAELGIGEDQFDRHLELLNCVNGEVDLRTGELLPHNPSHFHRRRSPVAYDPTAASDIWDEVLAHAFEKNKELKEFAQVAIDFAAREIARGIPQRRPRHFSADQRQPLRCLKSHVLTH